MEHTHQSARLIEHRRTDQRLVHRLVQTIIDVFALNHRGVGNRSLRITQLATIRASQHINGRFHRLKGGDRGDDGIPFGVDMKAHHRIGIVGTQDHVNIELFAAGINDGGLISILEQAIVGNSLTIGTHKDSCTLTHEIALTVVGVQRNNALAHFGSELGL